jgi:hypothetical protein
VKPEVALVLLGRTRAQTPVVKQPLTTMPKWGSGPDCFRPSAHENCLARLSLLAERAFLAAGRSAQAAQSAVAAERILDKT